MTLASGLAVLKTGLGATGTQAATIGTNVSRSQDANAHRQTAKVSTSSTPGGGIYAVKIDQVERYLDMKLVKAKNEALSDISSAEIKESVLQKIVSMFGSPKSGMGVDKLIADFEKSIEALSSDPQDGDFSAVRNSAQAFTGAMKNIEQGLQQKRAQVDNLLKDKILELNTLILEIKDINERLPGMANSKNSGAMLDQREGKMAELYKLTGIQSYSGKNGEQNIMTEDGSEDLLGRTSYATFDFSPVGEGAMNALLTYAGGGLSGINAVRSGGKLDDISEKFQSGELRGLLDIRDTIIPDISAQINQLATLFKNAVNKEHNRGISQMPLQQMISETMINASNFDLANIATLGSVKLVPDAAGQYGVIEFAMLDSAGNVPGTIFSLNLDTLKADIDTLHSSTTYQLTLQDVMNAVNGYYDQSINMNAVKPEGWGATEWGNRGSIATQYVGIGTASGGLTGPLQNSEFMQIDSNGKLIFKAPSNYGVVINDVGAQFSFTNHEAATGFNYPLQMNNYFTSDANAANTALSLSVRADIIKTPRMLATGHLTYSQTDSSDPTTKKYLVGSQDGSALLAISKALSANSYSFIGIGDLSMPKGSLGSYGAKIIESVTNQSNFATQKKEVEKKMFELLENQISAESGIDVDAEMMKLVPLRQHFAALSHMLQLMEGMFDLFIQSLSSR